MTAAKNDDEDTKAEKVAEVVRDMIGSLCKVVQLPREQRKEWVKILDEVIYGE